MQKESGRTVAAPTVVLVVPEPENYSRLPVQTAEVTRFFETAQLLWLDALQISHAECLSQTASSPH